jgi:RNA polymerase sigma-70 factor, ECF subfamily
MLENLKEKYLFLRLQRKDKDAFVLFYDEYFDKIYRYIYFKVGNKEEAEDLTSAFFAKLWNIVREGKIGNPLTFKSFVYTLARNLVIDHYRKTSQSSVQYVQYIDNNIDGNGNEDDGFNDKNELRDEKINLELKLDRDFAIEKIKQELLNLKDEYREIIILRYMEQLSIDETAKATGKTKSNVRVLTHRALKALSALMEKGE